MPNLEGFWHYWLVMSSQGLRFASAVGGIFDSLRLVFHLFDRALDKPVSKPYRKVVYLRKTPATIILEEENLLIDSLTIIIGQAKKSSP